MSVVPVVVTLIMPVVVAGKAVITPVVKLVVVPVVVETYIPVVVVVAGPVAQLATNSNPASNIPIIANEDIFRLVKVNSFK